MAHSLYPWSWSKLNSYLTCPRQYYEIQVAKNFKQDENVEYLFWGIAVHKAFEDNLMEGKPFEERFKSLEPLANKLNALPGDHYGEQKLAVDIELRPVEYDSPNAWVRAIVDRLVIYNVVGMNFDYKTGKRKTDSRQLELSSGIAFSWFERIQKMHTAYLWTQGGKPTSRTFLRDGMQPSWDRFRSDIDTMEWSYAHNAWPANPSGLCGPNKAGTYAGCIVLSCPHNRRKDAWKGRK